MRNPFSTKFIPLIVFIIIGFDAYSQNEEDSSAFKTYDLYYINPAEYEGGGMRKLYSDISINLKYPKTAKRNRIEGKVYVSFIINKDGSILEDSTRVTKGIGFGCDEEAIRLINLTKWKPATLKETGKPVHQKILIPITFKLR